MIPQQKNIGTIILSTLKSGLGGFVLFFTVLTISKALASFIGTRDSFVLEFEDVLLSLVGFVLMGLTKFLSCLKDNSDNC